MRCLCSTGRVGSSPITRTTFLFRLWEKNFGYARVVELADSLDSGSSAHYGRAGSSPASRTTSFPQKLHPCARVVELADSLDSGSSAHYGRAGSSPASRTIKETSFVYQDRRGFFLLSGQNTRRIIEKWALERSIGCSEAHFLLSAAETVRKRRCTNRISLLCKQLLNVFRR